MSAAARDVRVPTAEDRAHLDELIQALARLGHPLTLEDFRGEAIRRAEQASMVLRGLVLLAAGVALVATLHVLAAHIAGDARTLDHAAYAVIWPLAVGGLGASASVFLHLVKPLAPQATRMADVFEAATGIVIGALVAAVLSTTLFWRPQLQFFVMLRDLDLVQYPGARAAVLALAPFLFGYGAPLALRILQNLVRGAMGVEDRRGSAAAPRRR